MKIKILPEDKIFSQYIRLRDGKCVRCGSKVEYNGQGLPISHQCSHYWSRGNWGTRLDEDNCDTLCFACHRLWGGDYRADYTAFKKRQLGEDKYKELERKAHAYANKRKVLEWAKPYYKEKLQEAIDKK